MARYIDADALIKRMYPLGMGDGMYVINAKAVKFAIDNTPTADVVPKSEVDFLRASKNLHEAEFDEIKAELELRNAEIETLKAHLEVFKTEVAREIFADIDKIFARSQIDNFLAKRGFEYVVKNEKTVEQQIAELKKKYTEN